MRGAGLIIVSQGIRVVVQFLSVVVLSHLLTPDDFGLVAMVLVFIAFGDMLRDLGMTTVGLQRKRLSHQQASNLFWINSLLGLSTATLLTLSTGLLVALYDDSRLWLVVPALSPFLLINGIAAQIRVQLARRMRFVSIALADTLPQLLNFAVTAALALAGWDYWSIICGMLVASLASLIGIWTACSWWPTRPRRDGSSRKMLKDGGGFGLAMALTFLSQNADTALVGIRWNSSVLGIYTRGYQLLSLPISQVMGPLTQVVIPTINRAETHGYTSESILRRIQFAFGFITIWIFVTTGAIAEWIIPTLLGEDWRQVASLFQIFAIGGLASSFAQTNYWRVVLENKGLQLAYFNMVSKSIAVGLIAAASFISLNAIAYAVSLTLFVNWIGGLIWFRRASHWSSWEYFLESLRLVIPGAVALILGVGAMKLWSGESQPTVAVGIAAAISLVYVGGILVSPGGASEMRATLTMIRLLAPGRRKLSGTEQTRRLPAEDR